MIGSMTEPVHKVAHAPGQAHQSGLQSRRQPPRPRIEAEGTPKEGALKGIKQVELYAHRASGQVEPDFARNGE